MYRENNPDGKDSLIAYGDLIELAQNLCDRSEGATWACAPFEPIDPKEKRKEIDRSAVISVRIADVNQKVEGELTDIFNGMIDVADSFEPINTEDGVLLLFGVTQKLIWEDD